MNQETYNKAAAIHNVLMNSTHGWIKRTQQTSEYFINYLSKDVREAVENIAQQYEIKIFKTQDGLFLIPGKDTFLSMKESDINSYFSIAKEKDIFDANRIRGALFCYISLNLISRIYDNRPDGEPADYITRDNLIEQVNMSVRRVLEAKDEVDDEVVGFNLTKSCKTWDSFLPQKENGVKVHKQNTKEGFVDKSMHFLKLNGLVDIVEEGDNYRIYPSYKMNCIIFNGGLDVERISELKISVQKTARQGDGNANNR